MVGTSSPKGQVSTNSDQLHYMADQYGVDVRMSQEALLKWLEADPLLYRT